MSFLPPNAPVPNLTGFKAEELGLVEGAPIDAFETIANFALDLFNVPVVLVSIVQEERDRQFFASQRGLLEPWRTARQTPLSHSFCQYVKQDDAPLVVRDARDHARLGQNAAVADLNVIAYLGVPIHGPDGAAIGALCIIQDTPRDWSDKEIARLADLARCVDQEVALRTSLQSQVALLQHQTRVNTLRESIAQAFMAPDLPIETRFTELMRAGCHALGTNHAFLTRVTGTGAEAVFSYNIASTDRGPRRFSQSLTGLLTQGQQNRAFHDRSQSDLGRYHTLIGPMPGCYAGSPLICNGVLVGTLEFFGSRKRPMPWSQDDLSLLCTLSMFASANMGLLHEVTALRASETALLNHLRDTQQRPKGPAFSG